MTILLTPDQANTIESFSHIFITPHGRYMHMPYYFRDIGSGQFEKIPYEHLPQEVKDQILKAKGINL